MVILATTGPLSKRQLTFLRSHILRQRRKAEGGDAALEVPSSEGSPDVGVSAGDRDKDSKDGSPSSDDELRDRGEKTREQDPETIDEITNQVESLQEKLESLKEEKHRLFQQLKTVLHEEDEKKRQKEQEQKQKELENAGLSVAAEGTQVDPRLSQVPGGVKRSLPTSPGSSHAGVGPPPPKQHRAPLLPTPEPGTFMRPQMSGHYRYQPVSDTNPRQHYPGPRTHTHGSQRIGFHEQRFNPPPSHTQDVHIQGPHGGHDPHVLSHSQMAPQTQHSVGYGQPHPHVHELQPQYPGIQVSNYQYTPSPSPYGSMTNLQSPGSQSSQPMPIPLGQYQQLQQGYVQQQPPHEMHVQGQLHPHEVRMHTQSSYAPSQGPGHEPHSRDVHIQGQVVPHEMQMQGHTHHEMHSYTSQQSQMMATPSYSEYPQGGASYTHIHDPRHQKLVMEHQRTTGGSGSTITSPTPLQSPSHSSKLDGPSGQPGSVGSPLHSPAHPSGTRDRRHVSKK